MGKFSRDKGKRFERKIASILRARFPEHAMNIRRSIQSRQAEESDVTGIPGLWLELQDAADPTPDDKLAQAIGDAPPGDLPVAITHKTRTKSVEVSLRLRDFLTLSCAAGSPTPPLDTARVQVDLETFLVMVERAKPWERS